MSKSNKCIISAAILGSATVRDFSPTVPYTADEIAQEVVNVAKAGASVVHIHVRHDDGKATMDTDCFERAFNAIREACIKNDVDIVINLTTSGGLTPADMTDELRTNHLKLLKPEMCSFDSGSMNWGHSYIFENHPRLLEKLVSITNEYDIKPEVEIFDSGMIGECEYYIKKHNFRTPTHYQFVLGCPGGMDGDAANLSFLVNKIPQDATWSVTGIGKCHVPMMLAGLALGCDGLRVGLEDNVWMSKGVPATNVALVERAAKLIELAGREVATAADAREILGIKRKSW